MKKDRKPRGYKLKGGPSIDFCDYCFKPGCDPIGGSPAYRRKIEKRLYQGLCPSCGHMPCTCKSRDMSEEAAKKRELWIAQRKCKKCIYKNNCDMLNAIKCKKFVEEVLVDENSDCDS
jgi:hypothetical protein